jgi:hypothetical protein
VIYFNKDLTSEISVRSLNKKIEMEEKNNKRNILLVILFFICLSLMIDYLYPFLKSILF